MAKNSVDIVFVTRSNSLQKPGGDSLQASKYAQSLAKMGVSSATIRSISEIDSVNCRAIHLFNLDEPAALQPFIRWARSQKKPIALTTIHHPQAGLRAAQRYSATFAKRSTLRSAVERSATIRTIAKSVSDGLPASTVAQTIRPYDSLLRSILRVADLVLPLAESERRQLVRLVGESNAIIKVPNGREADSRFGFEHEPSGPLLCVGRVEPRKNSLLLARAAAKARLPLRFVGQLNRNYPSYVKFFLNEIESNNNLSYLGQLNHDDTLRQYALGSAHVSFSFCEVFSFVDIEASTCGLPLLMTAQSHSLEYFPAEWPLFDPLTTVSVDEASKVLVEAGKYFSASAQHESSIPTWAEVGRALHDAYVTASILR